MIVFDLIIRLVNLLLVPAACAYLGIVVVDAATGNGMLHGIADGIRGLTAGVLKLILTLFTAYLTIAGGVSGSVDRMALKTAKFAVSGAVPGGRRGDLGRDRDGPVRRIPAQKLDRCFRDAVRHRDLPGAVSARGRELPVL